MTNPPSICKADILVVDDTPSNLRLLTTMLTQHDYSVRCVINGEMALEEVQVICPDLILLDIQMPEMSGYEVCLKLKQIKEIKDVPVIFLSALGEVSDKVKAFEVGGADYISKPFEGQEVLARIENQLAIRKLQRQLTQQNTILEQEIRDRQQVETKLANSLALLQSTFDSMGDGIIAISGTRQSVTYNQKFLDMWGIDDPDTVLPDRESRVQFLANQLQSPEVFLRRLQELYLQPKVDAYDVLELKDGRVFECHSRPQRLGDGISGRVWVYRDITERRRAETQLQLEREKTEQLLLNILPEAIAERLKQKHQAIAEQFNDVTVLFADIVGFTELSSYISAKDLVGLLNRIFSLFDRLSERYGLEKIKTIGDAYMVVGGLPNPRPDHAEAIAEMALSMQQEIAYFRTYEGRRLAIRIGINTGAVVAGVIGTSKFSYDLWGDTVNIASRMESQGEPNLIQVAEATYQRLQSKYCLYLRGMVNIKGKGEMPTYWLTSRKNN